MDRVIAGPIPGVIGVPELSLDDIGLRSQLEAHHADSFGWALACCRNSRAEAEDVLQIVYLKVLGGRAIFDGRSAFKTWLFSVIRRTAAGQRRTEWLHRIRLMEFFTRQPSSDGFSGFEANETLRNALLKLPARQREVLHLVFYHDMSIQEAASIMGVGIGSARTHYERGKKHMRKLLDVGGIP